ncbi:MAG TPA: energy-coupling factor transporter ATPase [Clostridia bacterium]|jgi:energy-coupling factor transport system ATP-binding protein|nr:energy-coupling factor transporter ATPase [Clostridia bacterium]
MSNVIIEASNLSFTYSAKSPFEKVALKDISFKIYEGETVGIIGSTGSGKSTLVQHLNGLIKVTKGNLNVCGFDLASRKVKYKELRKKIGMLFQYPEYQLFEETVLKDVSFGPKNFGFTKEEATEAAKEAIKMVGLDLEEVGEKSPFELSGGQQRRVAIAGVIASKPEVLVLDEPTSGLDPQGKKAILELVEELKKSFCKTVIMISHNMDEIAKYCERVIVLNEGQIVFDGSQREFFKDPKNIEGTGLKLPQTVALREDLKARGLDVSSDCLTVEEVVDAIEKSGILTKIKIANNTEVENALQEKSLVKDDGVLDGDGGEE